MVRSSRFGFCSKYCGARRNGNAHPFTVAGSIRAQDTEESKRPSASKKLKSGFEPDPYL